ncbi:MAG: hypothetical protein ACTS73_02755 [Arsenophonus sp. NEOnobi-MAG3]
MISNKKSTLQVSGKPNITSDLLHEFICDAAKQLIATAVDFKLKAMLR